MRLLLIEDDMDLCTTLLLSLEREGFALDICNNGAEGLELACQPYYSAIILDRMLPQLDGLSLVQKLRRKEIHTPVLMLTALGRIGDRVDGLEAGADDYLTKPFDTRELIARIKALLRRPASALVTDNLFWGDLTLDSSELTVAGPLKSLKLSPKECLLLECFLQNPEKLLPRDFLIGTVWGANDIVEDANLDTYVCFLRRRFRNIGSTAQIVTVRGSGYRLEQSRARSRNYHNH